VFIRVHPWLVSVFIRGSYSSVVNGRVRLQVAALRDGR